jgi:hypothetical protein
MKQSLLARAGLVLLTLLVVATLTAFYGAPSPTKLEGTINDFSPRSTVPAGPYHVNGTWSLQLANGKADFVASLTMVHSDLWFIENAGDPESQAARNFHTHHIQLRDAQVDVVNGAIVVTGTPLITASGNQVFPGSTLQVEITGGNTVAPSNIRFSFGGPAAGHFTTQPYDGVVAIR